MKLAILIFKYYPYGGLQRDCLRFAKFCADQGHQVTIMTMDWQGSRPENLAVQIIPRHGWSNHARAMNFAKDVASSLSEFDKVIGFDRMPGLDFYFAGDLCFAAMAKEKHGFWFRMSSRYRAFCQLEQQVFAINQKTNIFVLTDYVKETYQRIYHTPEQRFILIPPGVKQQAVNFADIQANKKQLKQQLGFQGEFNLLQVGSDFKRKGVDRSIRALAALSPKIKNKIHLYIIGRGKARDYETLAKQLDIFDQVHFIGTTENIGDYMLAADLLLHTAYFETAGMVLIEALTFGLPIIVTGNCGYAFHIANAQAGVVLSTPFVQAQLNQNLQTLLDDKPLLEQFSQHALNYAANTDLYSMDRQCLEAIVQ